MDVNMCDLNVLQMVFYKKLTYSFSSFRFFLYFCCFLVEHYNLLCKWDSLMVCMVYTLEHESWSVGKLEYWLLCS